MEIAEELGCKDAAGGVAVGDVYGGAVSGVEDFVEGIESDPVSLVTCVI